MLKQFGTQHCEIDDQEGYLFTTINEPFYTAGKLLGWKGNPVGVGIAKEIVDFAAERWYNIAVTIGNNPHRFVFDAEEWKALCEKNKWTYDISANKILYVLPWSMMKKV
jgi:hypothetical protein